MTLAVVRAVLSSLTSNDNKDGLSMIGSRNYEWIYMRYTTLKYIVDMVIVSFLVVWEELTTRNSLVAQIVWDLRTGCWVTIIFSKALLECFTLSHYFSGYDARILFNLLVMYITQFSFLNVSNLTEFSINFMLLFIVRQNTAIYFLCCMVFSTYNWCATIRYIESIIFERKKIALDFTINSCWLTISNIG